MTLTCCTWIRRLFVAALGLSLFLCGVFLYINWIEIFTQMRGKEMVLTSTSRSYANWKTFPFQLNFDVYLFNWTNPEDFYEGSTIKPHFEQKGPYRFREIADKVDIDWHPHNHSVTYKKKATYYFDPEGSNGTLTDKITTINVVSHAAAKRSANTNYFNKKFVENSFKVYNEGVSITKTADEFLFTGYLDPLVTLGKMLSKIMPQGADITDRIGWMYNRNESISFNGLMNMYTGGDDVYKIGQVHSWNHMTHNRVYEGECGAVKGSLGEFFPPNLSKDEIVYVYMPNMCRALPLDYTETVQIHGVTTYKYSGSERSVDNGTLYPEEKCFCVNGKCEPSGIINVGPCHQNTSAYMSYPHFYKADPYYLNAVDGLKPEKEKHEFYLSLEPNAGVVMEVGGGFQLNFLTEPVKGIAPFENIPRKFMPIMWCEERVRVSPEMAQDIAIIPLMVMLGQVATGVLLAFGIILLCWYPLKYATQLCNNKKNKMSLLHPLAHAKIVPMATQSGKSMENFTLMEISNSPLAGINGTVKESLLGNTEKSPINVTIR